MGSDVCLAVGDSGTWRKQAECAGIANVFTVSYDRRLESVGAVGVMQATNSSYENVLYELTNART